MKLTQDEFTTDRMPYLYQSEYYSIAWGKEHYGFYIDPNGRKYNYNEPEDWNFYKVQPYEEHPPKSVVFGYETGGEITPEQLFSNLQQSNQIKQIGFLFSAKKLTREILAELLKSKVSSTESGITDQGTKSNALLIYIPESNCYKRILLSATGKKELMNTSKLAARVINSFGVIRYKR